MTCANCKALREELTDMRRQLGMSVRKGDALTLMQTFGITYGQANIVLRMYYAKRPLLADDFVDSDTVVSVNLLRAQVCKMRKILNVAFSNGARGRNSDGYWLTEDFRRRLDDVLKVAYSNP